MKRFFLSIVLNVLLTHLLFSQPMYTSAVQMLKLPASAMYISPIAKWTDNQSIMYLKKDASAMYFCLVDYTDFYNPVPLIVPMPAPLITGMYTQVVLPTGYSDMTVNDIYCVEDYAFFCGTIYNGRWTSVIGYFDIHELNTPNNTNIKFHILLPGTTNPPTGLDRLVAYKGYSGIDVVAFGDDMSEVGSTPHFSQTKIVEIKGLLASTPAWCDVADLVYVPSPSGSGAMNKQYVDDIFLTDNYVVLTGHGWRVPLIPGSVSDMYVHYLFGNKGQVLSDICGNMNYNRYFNDAWESNDTVVGTALEGDKFAISYVHVGNNQNFYTRVRVVDPTIPDNTYAVEYKLPQKYNPVRMVYHYGLKAVEVLQPVFNNSDFTMVDLGNSSSFTAPVLNPTSDTYHTMHGMYGNCFISSHENQIYLQNCSASLPMSTSSCPNDDYVKVSHIELMPINTMDTPTLKRCLIDNCGCSSPNKPLDVYDNCFSVE